MAFGFLIITKRPFLTTLLIYECMIDVKNIIIQSKGNNLKIIVQKPFETEGKYDFSMKLLQFQKLLGFKFLDYCPWTGLQYF